jgi:tRNA(His) guanylyltransferase
MAQSLFDRQRAYEAPCDSSIMRRVPVVIRVDGRNFRKVTKRLPRPYCTKIIELMSHTMLELVKQVDGTVFGYQQSDEISLILRNDQTHETDPWFGNRVQKMVAVSASIATYEFNNYLNRMAEPPDLEGPALFDAKVFPLPSVTEAVNHLIYRQQDCVRNAVTAAAYASLRKKYDRKSAQEMLDRRSIPEREDLLYQEFGIDFHRRYPSGFRMGIAAYLAPHIVKNEYGETTKFRWVLDPNLPRFADDQDFVHGILTTGADVFRPSRDLSHDTEPR